MKGSFLELEDTFYSLERSINEKYIADLATSRESASDRYLMQQAIASQQTKIAYLVSTLRRRDNKIEKLIKDNNCLLSDIENKRNQLENFEVQFSGLLQLREKAEELREEIGNICNDHTVTSLDDINILITVDGLPNTLGPLKTSISLKNAGGSERMINCKGTTQSRSYGKWRMEIPNVNETSLLPISANSSEGGKRVGSKRGKDDWRVLSAALPRNEELDDGFCDEWVEYGQDATSKSSRMIKYNDETCKLKHQTQSLQHTLRNDKGRPSADSIGPSPDNCKNVNGRDASLQNANKSITNEDKDDGIISTVDTYTDNIPQPENCIEGVATQNLPDTASTHHKDGARHINLNTIEKYKNEQEGTANVEKTRGTRKLSKKIAPTRRPLSARQPIKTLSSQQHVITLPKFLKAKHHPSAYGDVIILHDDSLFKFISKGVVNNKRLQINKVWSPTLDDVLVAINSLDFNPKVLLLHTGSSDLYRYSEQEMVDRVVTIYRRIKESGIKLIFSGIPPRKNKIHFNSKAKCFNAMVSYKLSAAECVTICTNDTYDNADVCNCKSLHTIDLIEDS